MNWITRRIAAFWPPSVIRKARRHPVRCAGRHFTQEADRTAFRFGHFWKTHRRLTILATIILGFAAIAGVAHAPFVRSRVLTMAVDTLRAEGVHADVDRLDYNLFTLRASIGRAAFSAPGQDVPFLTLDRFSIDLPWSVVRGPITIESLEIGRPTITIARDADGQSNVPAIATSDEPFDPIDIGRLIVSDLTVGLTDEPTGLAVDGRAVTLDMSQEGRAHPAGRLTMDGGGALKYAGRETAVTRIDGGFSFDGTTLTMEGLAIESPEAQVRLDGTVALLAAAPRVDVRYQGRAILDRLAPWVAPGESISGVIDFSGAATGALGAPDVTLDAVGRDLAWRDQQGVTLELKSVLSASVAAIDRVRLTAGGGGAIEGRARLALAHTDASRAEFTWTSLDLGSIARAAGGDLPRVASLATGRATAEWTGNDVASATAKVDLRLIRPPAGGAALPVAGRLSATLARGEWTMAIEGLATRTLDLDAHLNGRLDANNLAASTLAGRARAGVGDMRALLDELRGAGLDLPAGSPLTQGRASMDLALSGTIESPAASGSIEALGLDIKGGLALDGASQSLRGALTLDVPRLSPLMAVLAPDMPVEGAAIVKADVGGTVDNPLVHIVAEATGIEVAGQRFDRIDAVARLAGQLLTIERLDLGQGDGRLSATGRYALDSGRFRLEATGRGLSIAPIVSASEPVPASASAAFDLDIKGDGTIDAPQGTATIVVRDLMYDGYALGTVTLNASVGADRARLRGEMPLFEATIDASAALRSPRRFAADINIGRADLDEARYPLTGTVTASAKASGDLDRLDEAKVDVDLRLVDVTAAGAPVVLDRPGRLRYDAGRIIADDLSVRIGGTTLTAAGVFGGSADGDGLALTLKGGFADFLPFAHQVEGLENLTAAGVLDLTVHAAGTIDAPRVDATLTVADLSASVPDVPAVTNGRLQATFINGLLTIAELGATWQDAQLTGMGTVPVTLLGSSLPDGYTRLLPTLPDRARAALRLDGITTRLAAPFVDAETLGQIAASAAAAAIVEATSLELDGIRADVTFDLASLAMAGIPLEQERPTKLRLAGGRLDVVDWTWSGAGNQLSVTGGATLAGSAPEVQATLAGSLDLRMLGAVSRDIGSGGRADFDIRATGPLDDPAIVGEIELRDGGLAIRDPRMAVTELTGKVTLAPDRFRLVDLRANANGGTLQMSGDVRLDALVPTGGSISLVGRGLALEAVENLRSEIDLDLTLMVSDTAPELTGKVTVLRGSYRAPISLTGQLLSGVEVVPAVTAEPTSIDRMRLSVSVVSQEGILLDNNYGRLEVGTDLRVVGTASLPALTGRLVIAEGGSVFLAGQTWTLERGTVDFTNATRIEPIVDLLLTTRVQRYEIHLAVSGTPETLEANLSAPGGLSQADAVSLLLTGQVADDQTMAQTEIARGQLLLLLSGELLGFAGRAVGLDSAQVGRGLGGAASDFDLISADTDPSARLTVTKQLRRDVELVFSQSLRNSNDLTSIAIFRPVRALELRATTRDNNARTYEFRHELNAGGRAATARTSSSRAPEPRVSAVRWAGSPGFEERDLRGHVKLDEGDRFDFYRWQQDRDRLANFYHDRGYFETRIRATREVVKDSSDEPTLALTYTVERGPATSIVVEGATLPGGVVADMEDTWARALFDGFLQEDVEELAKRSLSEDGYLQAEAAAEIREDAAAGTKQIVVRVTPGTRVTDRRLVFEGQQHLSAAELEAVVRERRLASTAWLRPAEVEAALTAHYRSLGYQSATVSIGTPVFTGTTATLAVAVTEGPRFQIADVEVRGVSARPIAEVRKAFGVEPGAPYIPSGLEPARREVEIGYLRLGYNNVRVSVTSVADAESPSAHITLDVQEGRQQILRDVSITGAGTTTARTIERALDLTPGEPADVNDTYQAQKRLYDTGAFRRADVALEPIEDAGAADPSGVQPMRAVVSLEEVQPYRFRYGVRLTDDTGPVDANRELRPGVVADLLRRNLFGRAISAGLAGQAESDRRLARGILSMPRLFGLPVTSSLYLTRSRQEFNPDGGTPFVEDGSEVTAEQRFRPRPTMAVSYDYRFTRTHIFDPSADPLAGDFLLDVKYNIARVTGTFAWDTRDDPFNAGTGWLRSSGIEYAGSALGSELRFIKFIHQQSFFKTVARRVVLASAFRLGTATGFGDGLIFSERFFVGGGTSVRGFGEDGLGAVDFLGDPAGGASSLVLNQEVRFPLYKWVRGVGFIDAGNVFKLARDLRPFDLEAGAGFGLRIDTPFGLVRIDYGMPLTLRGLEPFGRWYFSLGQAF